MISSSTIEFRTIAYRYRSSDHLALSDVSFEIAPEEVCVIVGPSGSGKSTLLGVVSGLIAPQSGRLLFDGRDMLAVDPKDRGVGWVPQSYGLFDHMNVRHNIAFGLNARKTPKSDVARRVEEMVTLCQLEGMESRRVDQLSGGQRQRVAIARAMAISPRVLLLDEPFAALDSQLRISLRSRLKALLKEAGITTLFVTHDQSDAMALADKIAVFDQGRLVQYGTPESIWRNPQTPFVAKFFGNATLIRLNHEEYDLRQTTRPIDSKASLRIYIAAKATDIGESDQGVTARVASNEYLGGGYHVSAVLPDGQHVRFYTENRLSVGESVILNFKQDRHPKVFRLDGHP